MPNNKNIFQATVDKYVLTFYFSPELILILTLSKGSPLPFETQESAPSVTPTLGRFFQPEAD
jgi:hypothetical protein